MRLFALSAVFAFVSVATAEDKPAVRKLDVKELKFKYEAKEPPVSSVSSAEELSKSKLFADDASRDALKKQVDFTKEKLVVSAWSGSSGDRYFVEIEKGEVLTVNFVYQAGEAADVRPHAVVHVVPKDAKVQRVVQVE